MVEGIYWTTGQTHEQMIDTHMTVGLGGQNYPEYVLTPSQISRRPKVATPTTLQGVIDVLKSAGLTD